MQDAVPGSVPATTTVGGGELQFVGRGGVAWAGNTVSGRPRKVARASLTEEFTGLWADVWTNPQRKVFKRFASGDGDSQDEVLIELITDHNLPGVSVPLTVESINDMDTDVYLALVAAVAEALQAALAGPKASTKS